MQRLLFHTKTYYVTNNPQAPPEQATNDNADIIVNKIAKIFFIIFLLLYMVLYNKKYSLARKNTIEFIKCMQVRYY